MMTNERWPIPSVAALIINSDDLVMIKRGKEPSKGKWSLPGGKIELGETLESALKREILEETGLTIMPESLAGVYDLITWENNSLAFHYIIIDYYAHKTGGLLNAGDDAEDIRWVRFSEIESLDLAEGLSEKLPQMIKAWQKLHLDTD